MRTIRLRGSLTDEATDTLSGEFMNETHYDTLLTEDADVIKPDGSILLKFRKGRIPEELCKVAHAVLRDAAQSTTNRGMAGGKVKLSEVGREAGEVGSVRYYPKKKDGTISKTNHANPVNSGIIGYFDRQVRFPYCRQTAFQMDNPEKIGKAMPFIQAVNEVFKTEAPDRYENQRAMIEKTHPDFYLHDTVFTTVTVNRNFQTAVHKDAGDLKTGFGVMAALRWGEYEGGYLVFPKFRVAVDMRTSDVLLADVHEWHGNTAIKGTPGRYERVSCVFYYREHMSACKSAKEELDRYRSLSATRTPAEGATRSPAWTTQNSASGTGRGRATCSSRD